MNSDKTNDRFVFAEDIDYLKTGRSSIWGEGDRDTVELLKRMKISGRWLNLAAGDGRYNRGLLEKADAVVASDIDAGVLRKLRNITPERLRHKLKTVVFDITETFPFSDHSFDGVFCTGTLHLFPEEMLRFIFSEITRVLRPGGKIIIDFATDIRRVLPDGSLYIRGSEPQYNLDQAKSLLQKLLKNYRFRIIESEVPEEGVRVGELSYKFSCKFLLVVGDKQ